MLIQGSKWYCKICGNTVPTKYNAEHDIHIASNLRLPGWKEEGIASYGVISIAVYREGCGSQTKTQGIRKVQQ